MERAEDGAKLVPLRHRGFHKFTALHKDATLGMESLSLGPPEKMKMRTSTVLKKETGRDIFASTESAPHAALSTYKADFVRYDLPLSRVESLAPARGDRVPFRATTTYRMDYRTAVCPEDTVIPAGAGPRMPASVGGGRRRSASPGSVRGRSCSR
ncbi:PAS domain S-box containing protein, putative [Babesia ovata]|uniref:PAS domain S-box containing protein, putative n=1 Tax=Babesia ovata TaxID=189622 RepID=A0A2H6KFE7_9APIC|nr:PAS domain S-box containing protein, putative [Babesia ovata]GBE61721.1 PAS domain S-box containing protein, putative [Babesia ovata]